MERETAASPPMSEECPLELTLATLRAQVRRSSSSASAGEATIQPRPAWSVHGNSISALYAELRALLPNMPPTRRINREEILDAAVAQVKVLEDTAAVLEAYRSVRAPPRPRAVPEVAVAGATVCFSARLPAAGPGALRRLLVVFHGWDVEVLAATVARHGGGAGEVADAVVTVTAAAAPPEVMEMIKADIACIH